jgi:hypothetical protein
MNACLRMRAHQDEAEHRLRHSSPCQTAQLVPAPALLRPGFASLLHSPPLRGGRSAERRWGAQRSTRLCVPTRHARRLARRLASHDAGRTPPGAPPWRFLAPGAALSSRLARLGFRFDEHPDRLQRAPRSQVLVPGGRGPVPPGTTVTSRRRRTPHLAPHSGSSLEHALNEQGCESSTTDAYRSQQENANCSEKDLCCSPSARRSEIRGRRSPPLLRASPAGLTRGSIALRKKLFAKEMDGRVKPGHDGLRRSPD